MSIIQKEHIFNSFPKYKPILTGKFLLNSPTICQWGDLATFEHYPNCLLNLLCLPNTSAHSRSIGFLHAALFRFSRVSTSRHQHFFFTAAVITRRWHRMSAALPIWVHARTQPSLLIGMAQTTIKQPFSQNGFVASAFHNHALLMPYIYFLASN